MQRPGSQQRYVRTKLKCLESVSGFGRNRFVGMRVFFVVTMALSIVTVARVAIAINKRLSLVELHNGGSIQQPRLFTPRALSTEFEEAHMLPQFAAKEAKSITVLGERNVGSNWVTKTIKSCFPHTRTTVHLHRYKHDFQEFEERVKSTTIVVSVNRNVYDWTEAMRNIPHHSPMHVRKRWKEFVAIPWTLPERPESDRLLVQNNGGQMPEGYICRNHFRFDQIIPCIKQNKTEEYSKKPIGFSAWNPLYELHQDGSGEPFNNIAELRAAKIRNHLNTSNWGPVLAYLPVQYEMLVDHGTDFLISEVERLTGMHRKCNASKGALHGNIEIPRGKGPSILVETSSSPSRRRRLTMRQVSPNLVRWLTDHVDWETESLLGYVPNWRDRKRPPTKIPRLLSFNNSEVLTTFMNLSKM